jgi:cbb3-type cytochrome oxidase maturation protein
MSVIFLLIPCSVLLATGFLVAFIWAVRSGQYEDTCTPAMRILAQDRSPAPEPQRPSNPPAQSPSVTSK